MENRITVYLNSSVINAATKVPSSKWHELNELAKKEFVHEVIFCEDLCWITAAHTRRIKTPKKAISSSEGLVKWIEERIKAAWNYEKDSIAIQVKTLK